MFGAIGAIGRVLLIMFVIRLIVSALNGSRPRSRTYRTGGGTRPGPMPGGGPNAGHGAPPPPRQPQPPSTRAGGQLVRDPQCGTYVAESSAVKALQDGQMFSFCSMECRD